MRPAPRLSQHHAARCVARCSHSNVNLADQIVDRIDLTQSYEKILFKARGHALTWITVNWLRS
jgi:hypothetical protein